MKLMIVTDEGEAHVVCEELESFDLDKAPAQCVLIADIRVGMERLINLKKEE